ncbi:hypothetical protein SAMN04515691_0682 [Leifsonia sp. 98AMF]|uniref:hypothetical protein n=1 Tax=unclassified Leifsonia TaxID=2663824 RepID=UPI00087AF528|nr:MULTISPECIES: hypothetical protein [unclassified Leifsonia]SDH61995.1 hypothetical protein SAMN04515690_3338 [Leifsonia sp. 197AMF]SDI77168.1 hypothetical protein SAMN04515684_0450 [Leifsonia sp. 466MF]SDK09792.1 hypothetical protein SAMN04515683_2299 [Leifsonia sp. 157MF]SDN80540.1 hypothetical protein SAMN04515686_2652 [Leifsonia sp. 509MF]SEN26874.1 hypothetical protein SAMN04515685_2284 [Leifsonia sp. 467MF]
MREIVVILVSPDPDGEAEIVTLQSPDTFDVPPIVIRRPIDAPDGEILEIWERCSIADGHTAMYRLARIEARRC